MRPLLRWFLAVILLYVLAILLLARATGVSFDAVELNLAPMPVLLWPAGCLALILGYALAFVLPGLALQGASGEWSTRVPRAFIGSVLLHAAVLSLPKVFGADLTRSWLVLSSSLWWLAALLRGSGPDVKHDREGWVLLGNGVAVALALVVLFYAKVFVENFAGDGTEHFEYARSLKRHLFPYWDLENGAWGFHHRFFFFAYPGLLSILSVGEIEAAVRLPGVLYATGLFLLMPLFLPAAGRSRGAALLYAGAGVLLVFWFNAHYTAWDPGFADIAAPTSVDLLGAYLIFGSLAFLLRGERGWFLTFALLATITTQFGAVLTGLALAILAATSRDRRPILGSSAVFVGLYALLVAGFALRDHLYPLGQTVFTTAYLASYWAQVPAVSGVLFQLLLLALTTGGLVLLVVPYLARGDRLTLQLYAVGILYAGLMVLSARINPHYFLPPALFIVAAGSRSLALVERSAWPAFCCVIPALLSVWITAPLASRPAAAARELGGRVRIEAETYRDQVRLAQLVYDIFPFDDYGVGHHTLVYYASRRRCTSCDYIFAPTGAVPSGYEQTYARDDRAVLRRIVATDRIPIARGSSGCVPFLRKLYTSHRQRMEAVPGRSGTPPWRLCLDR
jgi:hypothetical protein